MDSLERDMKSKKFVFNIVALMPLVSVTLFDPQLAPNDPLTMNTSSTLAPSSSQYPPGTDEYGRYVPSHLLVGVRPSMTVALFDTSSAFVTGLLLSIFAGYLDGKIGGVITGAIGVILCSPPILPVMMVVGPWGAGVRNLTVVAAILYTPCFTRITYSSTIRVWRMEFVENEILIGVTLNRVLLGTIFPNIFSPLVTQISLTVSSVILLESGLSFLGLDAQPPDPSWGQIVGDMRNFLLVDMIYTTWPSLFLDLTVLATNLMNGTLRGILDPELRDSF